MEMVNFKINGIAVQVPKGSTILEAARYAGMEIPTLCYPEGYQRDRRLPHLHGGGHRRPRPGDRLRLSGGEGWKVHQHRKGAASPASDLELILSTHDKKCLSCVRSNELRTAEAVPRLRGGGCRYDGFRPEYDLTPPAHLVRDNNKCILCRRCVAACRQQQVR